MMKPFTDIYIYKLHSTLYFNFSYTYLKTIFRKYYNYNIDNKITFNAYKKPYIKDNTYYFNISHSGNYLVIIISDKEVGIDIQRKIEIDLRISNRFFHHKEVEYINQYNSINRFFTVWTIKESYIKFLGMGLHKKLNQFIVEENVKDTYIIIENDINKNVNIELLSVEDNYFLSICHLNDYINKIVFDSNRKYLSIG